MPDVYVKDRFVPEAEALIPVGERGFRFGDGVFETIAVHKGAPYQWAWHMQRLQAGLAAIRIGYDTSALDGICKELIRRNELVQGSLRIYISRGVGGRGYDPSMDCTALLVVETLPAYAIAPPKMLTLWLSNHTKISPKSLPVQYKIAQGMNSTLSMIEAREHGCDQSLLLTTEGMLCEASAANLFWMKDGALYTPSLATGALDGSTRAAIMRLSPWPVREVEAPLEVLEHADAVCITNTNLIVAGVDTLKPKGWSWHSGALGETLRSKIMVEREQNAAG